jgi:Cu/Zn superoxide dismutase
VMMPQATRAPALPAGNAGARVACGIITAG